MKIRYINVIFLVLLIISSMVASCPVKTIINTKTARPPLTSQATAISATAVYDSATGLTDVTVDNGLINGINFEMYVGIATDPNISTWGAEVSGWSCVTCGGCDDCSSFGFGGTGGGGDGSSGGEDYLKALNCGLVGLHILIDTNADGELDSDTIIQVKLKGPDGVTATDGLYDEKIEVDWSPHPNAVGGYSLYRSENSDIKTFSESNKIADLTGDFYIDIAPIGGDANCAIKDYFYAVKYITARGAKSEFSNCDVGYLKTSPGPVLIASDSANQTGIAVSWTPTISGTTKWRLERRDAYMNGTNEVKISDWRTISEPTAAYYDDAANAANVMYSANSVMYYGYKVKYYYRVRGTEGTLTAWSNVDEGSIADNSVAINSVNKDAFSNKINVGWNGAGGSIDNWYQLEKSSDNIYFGSIYNGGDTTFGDSGVSPDTLYYYKVVARRNYVWGVYSNTVNYTLIFEEWIPNITISVTTGISMSITWNAIPTAEKYYLERTPLNNTFEYNTPVTHTEDNTTVGIDFDTVYSYKIRGFKAPNRYTQYSGTVMGRINP